MGMLWERGLAQQALLLPGAGHFHVALEPLQQSGKLLEQLAEKLQVESCLAPV